MSPLVQPAPWVKPQYFDNVGAPLAGGKLFSFLAGTSTPLATFTDHTGSVQNTNPVILDAAGRAEVWLTATSYKLTLTDANNVQIWSVDGVPGLGSLISIGNLSPLFSSMLSGGAATFTFDNAPAYSLWGRFTNTPGAPSYGAVGTDKQITHNEGGQMRGSAGLLWDEATRRLLVINATSTGFANIQGGGIGFAAGSDPTTPPRISAAFGPFDFISAVGQDIQLGQSGNNFHLVLPASDVGMVQVAIAGQRGAITLNDGNQGAGVLGGPMIIAGINTPEGAVTAPVGSLFLRSNGGAGTSLYVKEAGAGNVGWAPK